MEDQELQVENGHFTRIANAILDSLISTPISGSELRMVLAVIRKTYGYQKKEDSISLSQLQELTGISKRNIIYLLQNLEAKKLIIVSRVKNECNIIRFNKYSDTWTVQSYAPQIEKNRNRAKMYSAKLRKGIVQSYVPSAKLRTKVVQNYAQKGESFAHTKERKKYTKETPEQSSEGKDISEVIFSFKEVNPSYKKWYGIPPQRKAIERLLGIHGKEKILQVISLLTKTNTIPYFPSITTPIQLEDKWASLESAFIKKKVEISSNKNKVAFS